MRTVKYRAWLAQDKEFAPCMWDADEIAYPLNEANNGKIILMQWTGLLDGQGKEIYEGDIVTSKEYPFQDENGYNYMGVIEWADECAAFVVTKRCVNAKRAGISDGIAEYLGEYDSTDFEVLGNIYENEELLIKQ